MSYSQAMMTTSHGTGPPARETRERPTRLGGRDVMGAVAHPASHVES